MSLARRPNVLLRALLTSIALVALIGPAVVLLGAFVPFVPEIGRLVAILNEGLPWIWAGILVAALLAGLAVVLGGRRFTLLLLAACGIAALGAGVVTWRYATFAADHGAGFDLLRMAGQPAGTRTADARVTYAEVEGQPLHVDLWRSTASDGGGTVGASGRPAVVYVHGGSFVAGGTGMRPDLFASLADSGIVVVDVQYRLAPPPRWQDAPADVLCALAWLRGAAEAEGIDPGRVVVMGESAGGSLALLAAYSAGTNELAPSCTGEAIVPAGVIAVAPAADLAGIWADRTLVLADGPFPEPYIGGSPSQYPDRYAAASPFRLMRANLPPTLLLAGERDHLVRLPRVQSIADALAVAGARYRLLVVPYADHGFDGVPNSYGAQVELGIVRAFVAEVAP